MRAAIVRDGEVEAVVRVEPNANWPTPEGAERVDLADGDKVGPGWTYDGATFTPPPREPEPARTRVTALQFLDRFAKAERVAIQRAAASDDDVADWLLQAQMAGWIDLASDRTAGGMQMLVDKGLVTSDRKSEILTP